MNVVLGIVVAHAGYQDQLSAEHFHLVDLLLAGALGHHHHAFETHGIGDDGETYTRVARSTFHHHAAGLQLARRHRR